MKCSLVKLLKLSGDEASIYTFKNESTGTTLFDNFILENKVSFKSEIKDIFKRLMVIGQKTGAREQFFKLYEGSLGDGVCALYDVPGKKLRLYCIRYGSVLLIIGSGGEKPKNIKKLQESEKLADAVYFLKNISKIITERIKSKDIWYTNDNKDFDGNLEFNNE